MKKLCLFSAIFAILLITGCSKNNEVVCSQSVSGVKVDMIMTFESDILNTMGLKYTMNLSDYSDAQVKQIESQNLCSTVQAAMGTYSTAFNNCNQKLENKNLIITADFDIDKIPGSSGQKETKEEAINQLEAQGYKCEK